MTRINVVPPSELHDKHLLAEYRELPRVFALARADADIPPTYRMGKGHVTFFFNKLGFLFNRQCDLVEEMKRRGWNPQFKPTDLALKWRHKNDCWHNWEPTPEALEINRARIAERMPQDGRG